MIPRMHASANNVGSPFQTLIRKACCLCSSNVPACALFTLSASCLHCNACALHAPCVCHAHLPALCFLPTLHLSVLAADAALALPRLPLPLPQ